MTTYLLRAARPGDLAAVRRLSRAIWREHRIVSGGVEGAGGEAGALWVVEAGRGEIVGSCGLRESEPGLWELHSLLLAPQWRGFGLGRSLVEQAVFSAQEQGALAIYTVVPPELREACEILSRLGFVAEAASPGGPCRMVRLLARSH